MIKEVLRNYLLLIFCIMTLCACKNDPAIVPSCLPEGFVFLSDVDANIVQELKYNGSENFIGRPIKGYESECVVVTEVAAKALSNVNNDLRKLGYKLVIYDAYRSQTSVNDIKAWTLDPNDFGNQAHYFPTYTKKEMYNVCCTAHKSKRARGSTVDVTIIRKDAKIKPTEITFKKLNNGETIAYLDDGSVDMGTSFDFYHPASHHNSPLVDNVATENRTLLKEVMNKHGFLEIPSNWWHYSLVNGETYNKTYFNFIVRK